MQNENIVDNSLENFITNVGSSDTLMSRDWGYEDKYGILPLSSDSACRDNVLT